MPKTKEVELNLTEMRRKNAFPWIGKNNHEGYRNLVIEDKIGKNILKAKITGSGRGREYRIKWSNIEKYVKSRK